MSDFGGWDCEAKWKNDGSASYDITSDALSKTEVDGLKDAQITLEGKFTRAKSGWPTLGFKWNNSDVSVFAKSPLENPKIEHGVIYRGVDNHVFAAQHFFNTNFQDTFWRLAWASQFKDTGIRWAFAHQGQQNGSIASADWKDSTTQFWAESQNGNYTCNGDISYDWGKHAYKSTVGLRIKQDDHTWKFRLHESGALQALLQWQLHRTTKVSLNSSVDLHEINGG